MSPAKMAHGKSSLTGMGTRPAGEASEPELVGREMQAGLGLFVGVIVYSAAIGGLFSLVFAFVYGRAGRLGPRATAALLALAGFVAIVLVPELKYPANPRSGQLRSAKRSCGQ
jgi:Probable cobalt transporter subunit (CbtA)